MGNGELINLIVKATQKLLLTPLCQQNIVFFRNFIFNVVAVQ